MITAVLLGIGMWGEISTINLDLKKCHLYAVRFFSSLNVQDELMVFLMYVIPVEIKLLMSLNCEVICYLPKLRMLVVYLRYGV